MSWGLDDVNLIIIHKGETRVWVGVSTCGHILLDERIGLYSENPNPDLSWISKSTWGEMLQPIDKPMPEPIYGDLVVDFDRRVITDMTGAGSPFDLLLDWMLMTWNNPRQAPLTKRSLRALVRAGRAHIVECCNMMDADFVGEDFPKTLPKTRAFAEQKKTFGVWIARFRLPEGWVYTDDREEGEC